MIIVDAKNSVEFVQKYLLGFEKQIPYVISRAINATADDVQKGLVNEMKSVFDRPTRWTLNSLMVEFANKQNQTAVIRFKDAGAGGRSAEKYLTPEILGGYRNVKGFENVLRSTGVLNRGLQVVPSTGLPLDASGNIKKSTINELIAFANAVKYKNSKKRFFVVSKQEGELEAGIYQRVGKHHAKPIILFVRQNRYKPRFSFYEVGFEIAKKAFERNFEAAAQKAIATARP
jgi:hypothetical protein